MKSMAFINQKGGVGKTTSSLNIGAGFARMGKKVLLIDFDPQANLTHSFGINPLSLQKTIYELIKSVAAGMPISMADIIQELPIQENRSIALLPANIALSGLENDIKNHPERNFLFKKLLAAMTAYDYVMVDCPPSLGILTLNVLAAVDEVYIPVQTEFFALQGLGQISDIIAAVHQKLNPSLKFAGIIGTKFNHRKLHKDVLAYLKNSFNDLVCKTVIRDNIALAEAPSFGKDIFSYNPKSHGAEDYSLLCKEIMNTHKKQKAGAQ